MLASCMTRWQINSFIFPLLGEMLSLIKMPKLSGSRNHHLSTALPSQRRGRLENRDHRELSETSKSLMHKKIPSVY